MKTNDGVAGDNSSPFDEQLVAYLDGELDAAGRDRIESQLAADPKLRGRLQSLERTWDLLDELDATPAGEPFTHTTLEMVAATVDGEVERERTAGPRRRRRQRIAMLAALLTAAAAGFLAVALFSPDPNRRLLEELPLLERFDQYRYAESAAFLRMLRDSGLFAEDATEQADQPRPAVGSLSLEERRQLIVNMNDEEKEQLRSAEERFGELSKEKRQKLRLLHDELHGAPDADQLMATLDRYYDWLIALPAYGRAGLIEAEPEKRIELIGRRMRIERRESAESLPVGDDLKRLWKWAFEYVAKHEDQFIESLSEPQRQRLKLLSPQMRRRVVFGQMLYAWRTVVAGTSSPLATDDELARLRERLSYATRRRLESLPTAEQWWLAASWLSFRSRRPGGFGMGRDEPTRADDERLAEFFEKELSPQQRDRLLGLPADEMQRELHRLFLMRDRKSRSPRYHSHGGRGMREMWNDMDDSAPREEEAGEKLI